MCRALIIGAGGVGTVVTQKVAANPIFSDVMLASRTKSKCDAVAAAIGGGRVKTAQVDADSVPELCELFRAFRPDIVINVALPYQDLTIMDACLECGAGCPGIKKDGGWMRPVRGEVLTQKKPSMRARTTCNGKA